MNFNFVVVYFIYGLAFFSMGLAMFMEARRSPIMAEARVLWPLAIFGLIHGTHEWLEIGLEVRSWFGFTDLAIAPLIRLVMLIFSFSSLALYGLQVLRPPKENTRLSNLAIVASLLCFYLLLVLMSSIAWDGHSQHWVVHADALARYTLAVPGAGMGALALWQQGEQAHRSRTIHLEGKIERDLEINFRLASIGLAIYCLTQMLVAPVDFFPGNVLNSAIFMSWAGFPIQAVRATMAVLVTFGLIRATQVVEAERARQLEIAQEARLNAMKQIQHEMAEREAQRRELLLHTVLAQEEERARIARELHDETAQFLTALSLYLASLRNSMRRRPKEGAIIERLQVLSRQMSQGIYRMVHDLRPAQLDDLGLAAALIYLAEEGRENGLEVGISVQGDRQRMDPLVETVLFRIAQEALTNVARHAGSCEATITLEYNREYVCLSVRDNGIGFNPSAILQPPHGWGLVGMRERAESVGGQFVIESAAGLGTCVSVKVPLQGVEGQSVLEE